MIPCISDACIFKNKSNDLYLGTYVYEIIIIGVKEVIKKFIMDINKRFTITTENNIVKFVGCEV